MEKSGPKIRPAVIGSQKNGGLRDRSAGGDKISVYVERRKTVDPAPSASR